MPEGNRKLPTRPQDNLLILPSSALLENLKEKLSSCPSDAYIIVSQPGVNSLIDFEGPNSAQHLWRLYNNAGQRFSIPNIIGNLNADELQAYLEQICDASLLSVDASTGYFQTVDDMKPRVIRVDFPRPPTDGGRQSQLDENGAFLHSIVDLLPSRRYTILYTTTPVASEHLSNLHLAHHTNTKKHQRPFDNSPAHMNLKREEILGGESSFSLSGSKSNGTSPSKANPGLFSKYQFFSEGLFVGLVVTFLLLLILTVAIRGVASLEVSYAAFDKEMGPMVHKKQQ
ncbi:MAG: hypothetical protein M1829_006171 [Trizodia sp. TS-e1964]|nr:MAG: hypothetical protein M1829_006171 [Trizodia sp. TS-e1964]